MNESVKNEIKSIDFEKLEHHGVIQSAQKSGYVCPNCGNGNGEDGTGIIPREVNGKISYHCFKCGASFDNLSLIAKHYNLELQHDFPKILEIGATILGTAGNFSVQQKKNFVKISKPIKSQENFSDFIESAFVNIENLPKESRRGLTLKTWEHFNCGFVADWTHPKAKNAPKTARIIIPTSEHHYLARAINKNIEKQFQKMHVGHKEIFNADALKTDLPVIIVEGEIDAMSIWQATCGKIPVIAVGGAANYRMLLNYLENNPKQKNSFIVMFDNDDAGQTNAKNFVKLLNELHYPAVNKILTENKFDCNDFLMKNEGEFKMTIEKIYDEAVDELAKKSESMQIDKDLQEKISDFEMINDCKVNPEILPKIKEADNFAKNFVAGKISVEKIFSDEFKNNIGYAIFYGITLKSTIIEQIKKAKNLAIAEIKNKPTEEISESIRAMANFDDFNFVKQVIYKTRDQIEKEHKNYWKPFRKEILKKEHRKEKLERENKQAKYWAEKFEHGVQEIEYLYTLPQSEERDEKIISTIKNTLESKNSEPILTDKNYSLIFKYDPFIHDLVGYNEFSKMDSILKKLPWRKEFRGDETWSDSDDSHLRIYIGLTYKLRGYKLYYDYFDKLTQRNTFHPIKNFLENLPEWDGVVRAEKVFIDFLKVADTPYAREVTFKTLLGAIARVYNPGCEYQTMPVLCGKQGIGKGYVLKKLGDPYYMELVDNVESSHAIDAIQRGWIIELPELQSFGRASINRIKSFISAREDTHRFAYARKATTVKRANIFIGTTNETHPLEDNTGARRFLILECGNDYCSYVTGLTTEYVQQIWAEMMLKYRQIFKDGFDDKKLLLSDASKKFAAELAGQFTKDDGMVGEILDFLDTPIPHQTVWRLLSKEERRRFFSEKHIQISADELISRQNSHRSSAEMQELTELLDNIEQGNDSSVRRIEIRENGTVNTTLNFYGYEMRDSICAAEIYNECFGNDRRKSMSRISEVLTNNLPEEWQRDKRRRLKEYGDQKNIFVRMTIQTLEQDKSESLKVEVTNITFDEIQSKLNDTLCSGRLYQLNDFRNADNYINYLGKFELQVGKLNEVFQNLLVS